MGERVEALAPSPSNSNSNSPTSATQIRHRVNERRQDISSKLPSICYVQYRMKAGSLKLGSEQAITARRPRLSLLSCMEVPAYGAATEVQVYLGLALGRQHVDQEHTPRDPDLTAVRVCI